MDNSGQQVNTDRFRGRGGYIRGMQQRYTRPYMGRTETQTEINNPRRNMSAPPAIENDQTRRFPTPVFPNRPDFCFYHRMFGRAARNHELPCAWIYPANNNK